MVFWHDVLLLPVMLALLAATLQTLLLDNDDYTLNENFDLLAALLLEIGL